MEMTEGDLDDLRYARALLESPSLADKLMNVVGTPIEKGFALLPRKWREMVQKATVKALNAALDAALTTLDARSQRRKPANILHMLSVGFTGGVGGFFGLEALPLELPITTTLMLRSIADIARSEGEDLTCAETRMACIEVFAYGGKSRSDDAAETGYFVVRTALANTITDAAAFVAERSVAEEGAPVLVRLITQIASRFEVVVSEKAAATAIPVIGAAGGALINTIFMDHFQDVARGHFLVRRLERSYGREPVRAEYERLHSAG